MSPAEALQLSVTAITDVRMLADMTGEIDALARTAIEPNVFYEGWMLQPALELLQPERPCFAVVRDGAGDLTGLFPFQIYPRLHGLPIRNLRSLHHDYCFLRTPLISARYAQETLLALFDWVQSGQAPAATLELVAVSADGIFSQLLATAIARRPRWTIHTELQERALFLPQKNPDTGVSGKHRKELRRLERRLAEHGDISYRALSDSEPFEPWVDRFLDLEASGWKGRGGTALGSDERSRQYFQRVASEARKRGRIQMLALDLAGAPIAMKCNFLAGAGSFAFKIAHDERYAKYSPGVLLELYNMEQLASACPGVTWMDSCAKPQHFMINRLWTERRVLANHVLASGRIAGAFVHHWPRLQALRGFVSRWSAGG
jgi:CelD/BcsL family acetyltransferase involved in cellulose biosynthesis